MARSDWLANQTPRSGTHFFQCDRPVCDVDGGFRDAVHVDQGGLAVTVLIHPGQQAGEFQSFTAENHIAQRQISGADRQEGTGQLAEC